MKRIILATMIFAANATGAYADPILTPLIAASLSGTALAGTAFTIGAASVTYASIAPHSLKAPK
ncbi:hypothetical protein IPV08_16940 [Methylobacterium sp. SD274]|uniref:hypothetical protein n=1 Tax=Methylobacterium sp. SD274 TaxID=2782009 RepID=UPI001A966A08|nr:hypothetical protein [Methylobacterium sp. SD274]MBO1021648.1 hypothetical protein [Methylobacterium sp. SD274]